MKVFSWSGLVFVLSISFIWSCGYWLFLQSGSWQLLQQKNELTQRLDKAQTLLQDWQQGYELHLAYLETELREVQQLPVTGIESALVDPLQQLDEQIRRVLWPDPLLAYAVLDAQGRVQRFSSADARGFYSQTKMELTTPTTFLPPLVLKDQWVLPLQVDQQQQRLVLWFDARELQNQLQRLMAAAAQTTEILLVSQDAEMLSRSRFQKSLLPRLGLDAQDPQQAIRIYAKRPPENLLRSKQRYQDAGAWPLTTLMAEVRRQPQGFIASHYLNYLGRATLASYRQLPDWQLYLVVERDAGPMLDELATMKLRLLAALSGLSLLLSAVFYFLLRKLGRIGVHDSAADTGESLAVIARGDPSQHGFEPPVLGTLEIEPTVFDAAPVEVLPNVSKLSEFKSLTEPLQEPATERTVPHEHKNCTMVAPPHVGFPAAAALLEAWLQMPHQDPKLADISRNWLQQVHSQAAEQVWCCDLMQDLTAVFAQRHQANQKLTYMLEASSDFPTAIMLHKHLLMAVLQNVLTHTEMRVGSGTLLVRLILAEDNLLHIEVVDQSQSLTDGQWLTILTPKHDDPTNSAQAFRQIQKQLSELKAHLSARADITAGNKMVLVVPCEVPEQLTRISVEPIKGSAMLLCPPGASQQVSRRLLKQAGLDLLPMDDASQLLQWCESSPQELSKMLIDEEFIISDTALPGKIAAVVRRYFPDVQILLVVRQPQRWLEIAKDEQLLVLAKPLTSIMLHQAFQTHTFGLVTSHKATVWLCQPDPLQYWWIEQQLLHLHYRVLPLTSLSEWQGDLTKDVYCLPWSLSAELNAKDEVPEYVLWCQESAEDHSSESLIWMMRDGGAALSQFLYEITLKQQGSKAEMNS